jgi:hypothetical protein
VPGCDRTHDAGGPPGERSTAQPDGTTEHLRKGEAMAVLARSCACLPYIRDRVFEFWKEKRKRAGKATLRRLQVCTLFNIALSALGSVGQVYLVCADIFATYSTENVNRQIAVRSSMHQLICTSRVACTHSPYSALTLLDCSIDSKRTELFPEQHVKVVEVMETSVGQLS